MKPLKTGDTIGLVSPASKAELSVFSGIAQIARGRGYSVKTFGSADLSCGRMAGTDEERAANLLSALNDPEVDAVLCSRGGYGSGRLLDVLEKSQFSPKIFVGYSDITSLLLHFHATGKMIPFHGPMASDLVTKGDKETLEWFFEVLEGQRLCYELRPELFKAHRPGYAKGPFWGGNISMIQNMVGTDSIRVPEGAIVMLEDINEFMYTFDRSLVHLKRAGLFRDASAIIFSDLKLKDGHDKDNSLGMLQEDVIDMNFGDFKGPIIFGMPCGHTESQMTLPLGVEAILDARADASLSLSFTNFWGPSEQSEAAA